MTTQLPMTAKRAALVRILELYGLSGYRTSHIEIQKLAYFLKAAGEPNLQKLNYRRCHDGLYAHDLNPALQQMDGHYIQNYGEGDDRTRIQVLPEGCKATHDFLEKEQNTHRYLDRVNRLVLGFETPYGLEMLATLHWVAQEDPIAAVDCQTAIQRVQAWSDRKKARFKPGHLEIAWKHLKAEGWLD